MKKNNPITFVFISVLLLSTTLEAQQVSESPSARYRGEEVPLKLDFFLEGIGLTGSESQRHSSGLTQGGGGPEDRFESFGELRFRFVNNFWIVVIRDYTNDARIEEISLSVYPGGQIPDFFAGIYEAYIDQLEARFGSGLEYEDDGVPVPEGGTRTVRYIDESFVIIMELDLDRFSFTISR